ncbi:MAG: endonuclease/exonuclease/phosphatase family protein [Proteobacteria bacterium]|nr:endonuclease/exonuclease/phosphatase family protein [Pseudomonadota bacterium]
MRITTWNVNSLNARLQHVLDGLAANPVDVLALQELKLTDDRFAFEALRAVGYEAAVFGQKTYNGVALLTRAPLAARAVARNIPGFDDEAARVIAATLDAPGGPLRLLRGGCARCRRVARAAADRDRPVDEDAHAPRRAGRGHGPDLPGRAGCRRRGVAHAAPAAGRGCHLQDRFRASRRAEGADAQGRDAARRHRQPASVCRHRRLQHACRSACRSP